ncbi:MAG TPA: hypothetical protein PLN52_14425 [Opitutaceae bacterium]|nr:hypothetical protein [Opitutaceae bacterium]
MPLPFQPYPLPPPRPQGSVQVVPHYDVQWGRPIFRAPSLPTPAQFYSELPFTATRLKAAGAQRISA